MQASGKCRNEGECQACQLPTFNLVTAHLTKPLTSNSGRSLSF